jgi:hypothetical protein
MTDDPKLIDQNCAVRPCVIEKGLDNCSQCERYACEKLESRLVTFEEVQQRVGGEISEADYQRFIRPYENRRRLEALRRSEAAEEVGRSPEGSDSVETAEASTLRVPISSQVACG